MRREDWDRKYSEVDRLWGTEPNRILVTEVSALAAGRSLDLACGEGRNSIWLAERGWDATGVDFSSVAISTARARAREAGVEATFACEDLVHYQPASGAYDLVLLLYLHVPVHERETILNRVAEALAPGGTFLLVGHDLVNLTDGVGGPTDPTLLYTPEQIVAELPPDLEIEKAERVLRDVEGAERPAIDALVRARKVDLSEAPG